MSLTVLVAREEEQNCNTTKPLRLIVYIIILSIARANCDVGVPITIKGTSGSAVWAANCKMSLFVIGTMLILPTKPKLFAISARD